MSYHREEGTGHDGNTSFAVDAVRRLGSRLDAIQDKHDWAATASISDNRLPASDKDAAAPPISVDLTHCTSLHSPDQLRIALEQHAREETIELARVTYAAYGIVLDRLLRDAERVNDQAWFWSQVEEDPTRTILYLIQSESILRPFADDIY